ncbi:MAG: hypothetical protein ACREFE_05710 [Limisphaerales bacterium]
MEATLRHGKFKLRPSRPNIEYPTPASNPKIRRHSMLNVPQKVIARKLIPAIIWFIGA